MGSLRRKAAAGVPLVGLALAGAFVTSVIVALGIGFEIYLGGMLFAWTLFAFVVPMATGVMAPSEVVDNVRSRMRAARYHEGEPLPTRDDWQAGRLGRARRANAVR